MILLVVMGTMCANPGTPTGGPKDKKPPVMLMSKPAPNSKSFDGKQIVLTFDENIQVKDADQKLVMSPPILPAPKVDAHGQVLTVRIDEKVEFMPNTTYTLDFSDCVSDLNEGNIIEGFTFSFSTGESQDSMMISGNVYDAAKLEPLSGIYVLLHSNLSDTAFQKVSPIRIAKTDDRGRFEVKNVPAQMNYRLYVLDDQNRNFLYDQKGLELIAWYDSILKPSYEIRQVFDSVRIDTLYNSVDTTEWVFEKRTRDTLVYTPDSLVLYAFAEDRYDQYIVKDSRSERNKITLNFNNKMQTHPKISFVGQDSTISHATVEYSQYNDTVVVWMTDTTVYKKDSVVISVTYPVLDTLNNMVLKSDTLEMWHYEKKDTKKSSRKERDNKQKREKTPTLKLSTAQSIGVYGMLTISSPTPLKTVEWDSIELFHKVDSLFEKVDFSVYEDTINLKVKRLKAKWEPGEQYKLVVDSAAVYDVYDMPADASEYAFSVTSLDKYGTLYINVDSVPKNSLLQLVMKDEVLRQNYVPDNGKVAFRYLKPGEYMIRLLLDDNRNGKWDSGDFEKRVQPEQFIYYMEKVAVRAHWEIQVDFEVGRYSIANYVKKFKKIKPKSRR